MHTATGKKTFALYDAGGSLQKNWFVFYYEGKKRVRKYGDINKAKTLEARRMAADALLAQLQRDYQPPPANAATKAAIYAALEERRGQLRPKSFTAYHSKINYLFEYLGGDAVDAANLAKFFQFSASNQAPGTAHDTYYTIKRVLAYLGLEHLAAGTKPPAPAPTPLRYFQPYQAAKLKRYLEGFDTELLLWCQFVYYCFIRPRSELRFLLVSDILFEERKILLRASISKNKKNQYVSIPDAFYPSLDHLQERRPASFVFEGRKGKPVGYNTLGARFTKALQHLGFDTSEYSVYSWKHTGAVACVKAGIGLKELQLQLRHHSLDQVDEYLRQLGVNDFENLRKGFPAF